MYVFEVFMILFWWSSLYPMHIAQQDELICRTSFSHYPHMCYTALLWLFARVRTLSLSSGKMENVDLFFLFWNNGEIDAEEQVEGFQY